MKKHIADYYACITCLDYHVGRIIDYLRQSGELDNTIIIFTSDQGLAVGGRHGLMGKQNLYEHFKSPLILAGPGIPRGRSPALVYLFDLFPTLCAAARLDAPEQLEGINLLPVVRGQQPRVRAWLFAAYRDCQRMARDERWKILWYPKINRFQLFDLANDPWEIDDLSARPAQAARLGELKTQMVRLQQSFGDNQAPHPK